MNPELQKLYDQAKTIKAGVDTLATAEKQGLKVTGKTTVERAQRFINSRPKQNPPVDTDGAVGAETIKNGGAITTPPPTAPTVQETYQTGILESANKARTDLETKLTTERDAALKRQQELNKRLESIQKESDPTKRATYEREQRIVRNQLDAAETASRNLEKDIESKRAITDELIRTSSQINTQIEIMRSAPVALKIQNGNLTQTIQNGQARVGILQATVSALSGNITEAHTVINNASNAVASMWQDEVAYNNAYLELVQSGQLATNKIHDDYASSQIALAEQKLTQLEETKKYITDLMIDPKTAQFMAEAGVTLNDSIDEINTKMQKRANYEERTNTINELTLEGYEYVPFPGTRSDVVTLEVGGQKLAFVPPPEPVKGGGGSGGPLADFEVDFSSSDVKTLQGAGFSSSDIALIEQSINQFGVEATLAGVEDPNQRVALATLLKAETALATIETPPTTFEDVVTAVDTLSDDQIEKLKSMADVAGVSSFWTGKRKDVKRLFNTPEMKEIINSAISRGLTVDEVINAIIS